MNSIDTNILFYALNRDCPESESAFTVIKNGLKAPENWILSDQVYLELYKLIQNPAVLEQPLSRQEAFDIIHYYRNESGWLCCSYDVRYWQDMVSYLQSADYPSANIFDLQLAVTLKNNNVKKLYTRNIKDFALFPWLETVDPVTESE